MECVTLLIICVVLAALAYDFINGFHDAGNSIATVIATRVLTPRQAILMAAFFNFFAVFFFSTGVAKTVGSGLISLDDVTPLVILCGLLGACVWGLITWWFRLPSSSSHALLGGYAGSAMTNHAMIHGAETFLDPIIITGWYKVFAFIVVAPALGLVFAFFLMRMLGRYTAKEPSRKANSLYRKGQLVSAAFLSLMHGGNDAQKTAGILTGALFSAGILSTFEIPMWVLVLSYGTIALGTLAGGWRIIKTMGHRLTRLEPRGGVCAESGAAISILAATLLHLPISTTHVVTGSILGVGAAEDHKKVRWSMGRRIMKAWVFTIPVSAAIGGSIIVFFNAVNSLF